MTLEQPQGSTLKKFEARNGIMQEIPESKGIFLILPENQGEITVAAIADDEIDGAPLAFQAKQVSDPIKGSSLNLLQDVRSKLREVGTNIDRCKIYFRAMPEATDSELEEALALIEEEAAALPSS